MNVVIDQPQRYVLTSAEYFRMGEAGVFPPEARLELIEGDLIEMAPIGTQHAALVDRLNRLLVRAVGDRAIVRVQNPVHLNTRSVPQPDFALLRPRRDYPARHPGPGDTLLLIEVADSTLGFDRGVKARLYARTGVSEYWVIDVAGRRVLAYAEPGEDGYRREQSYTGSERLEVAALPGVWLAPAEIFAELPGADDGSA